MAAVGNSNAPASETDIFYPERVSEDAFRFVGKVPGLNAPPPTLDGVPSIDDAGNLFFVSSPSYDTTLSTLYSGVFRDGQASEARLVAGTFSRQQRGWLTMDAEITRDGSLLYFANARFTGGPVPAEADLGLARRSGGAFQVTLDSGDLFRNVNTGALEYAPSTSGTGLELYFTRLDGSVPRILKSTRANPSAPFSPPEPVRATRGFVEAPSISCDGHSLALPQQRRDGVLDLPRDSTGNGGSYCSRRCGRLPGYSESDTPASDLHHATRRDESGQAHSRQRAPVLPELDACMVSRRKENRFTSTTRWTG